MMYNLQRLQFDDLVICSVRYCLGRHTYMPGNIQDIVKQHYAELEKNTKLVLQRDISEWLEENKDNEWAHAFGDVNYRDWCDFLSWMKMEDEGL